MTRAKKTTKNTQKPPKKALKNHKRPLKNRQNLKKIVENLQELHRWQGLLLNNLAAQLAADSPGLPSANDPVSLDQDKS